MGTVVTIMLVVLLINPNRRPPLKTINYCGSTPRYYHKVLRHQKLNDYFVQKVVCEIPDGRDPILKSDQHYCDYGSLSKV